MEDEIKKQPPHGIRTFKWTRTSWRLGAIQIRNKRVLQPHDYLTAINVALTLVVVMCYEKPPDAENETNDGQKKSRITPWQEKLTTDACPRQWQKHQFLWMLTC